jgi:hypothetical protein
MKKLLMCIALLVAATAGASAQTADEKAWCKKNGIPDTACKNWLKANPVQ